MQIEIHGWHVHPEAAVCVDCGRSATVAVNYVGEYDEFNLCASCLKDHDVRGDKIEEVFRELGF